MTNVFVYSETVLNRCVPNRAVQQPDSRVSKTGLRDFFQVVSWLIFFFFFIKNMNLIIFHHLIQEVAEDLYSSWCDVLLMCFIAFGMIVKWWNFNVIHMVDMQLYSKNQIVFSIITLVMFKFLARVIVWMVLIGVVLASSIATVLLW